MNEQQTQLHPWKDPIWLAGIGMITLSTLVFLFVRLLPATDNFLGFFAGNYSIAILYFFMLLINGVLKFRKKNFRDHYEYVALFLILAMISAFSLNREFNVFHDSVLWLQVQLVAMCIVFALLAFRRYMPLFFSHILMFILGISFLICIYYALYLAPYYHIAIIGVLILGMSLHLLVPLYFVIFIGLYAAKSYKENKKTLISFSAGIILPLVFTGYFIAKWNSVNNKITYLYNSTLIDYTNDLPEWVKVSMELPDDWITEKAIKSDLVYVTPRETDNFFRSPNLGSFAEVKQHDPLVMIAAVMVGKAKISDEEKIKILESMYDARHLAQERLWRGKDLSTSNVITDVMVYSDLHMAYTEKILSVKNNKAKNGWWGEQQEAIYTFKMPEGTVVTSLSLWINGQEEKGILTTKAKADSAYKTIVGIESRDPSIVHWQEGNTVSVRIFPCTTKEDRRFRIGFTSPLKSDSSYLLYENISFEGPSPEDATETVMLRFKEKVMELKLPSGFQNKGNMYSREGSYQEEWKIEMPNINPSGKSFSFENSSYTILPYKKKYEDFAPEKIYLDVNRSWSRKDFNEVMEIMKGKPVFLFLDNEIKFTAENQEEIFERAASLNFSLFPFHKVGENVLVISKSPLRSPNLKDLGRCQFVSKLSESSGSERNIRFFNIGSAMSPYLKTLKEFRAFIYDQGGIEELKKIADTKRFVVSQETENIITLHTAGINIVKEAGMKDNTAPDHLMRLFTYNDIVKDINKNYFRKDFINESLIEKARKAYVVSPVSSLIVLETQQDYERFGIKDSENSLKNASRKSSGAVPEPHEWCLIIVALSLIAWLVFRNRFSYHAS
jgi:XrtN system VIT domain protein